MKKTLVWFIILTTLVFTASGLAEKADWMQNDWEQLNVGNPTPLRGRFFTTLWGGTTSDLDVQELLHAYSPVIWDKELVRFRYDKSVLQNAIAMDDEAGNRTYVLVFYDDLQFSDGTPITAYDYAFSILLAMDPAVTETGGKTEDFSWLVGSDEYLNGSAKTLTGVKVITDQMMQIQVKAEALPYFYELSRLIIHPYPIGEIAPGIVVFDEGNGVYLSEALTAKQLKKTVMDPAEGYLSHPKTVSGPYKLESFNGTTAVFEINPKYKGNEEGWKPQIRKLRYTLAENGSMIGMLEDGKFGLLNKVTGGNTIRSGLELMKKDKKAYDSTQYDRTGLTVLKFMENSPKAQEEAVRKAIALCFDRDGFIRTYAGEYGTRMDVFAGIGQWMYRLASGQMEVSEALSGARVSTDGVVRYECDVAAAKALLDEAGWNLNENGKAYEEGGVRFKEIDGELTELKMTMGIPESDEAREALEEYLLPNLEEAGIAVSFHPVDMTQIETNYEEEGIFDLLYLGENFTMKFDPQLLAPTEGKSAGGNLTETRKKLLKEAEEMVRTEPTDVTGFMQKWIRLQEQISEMLPVLPVYSNTYYDFYTRELHNYGIIDAVTWGEAIVKSFMSDIEELAE